MIENRKRDNVLEHLNLLKSYHNRNENLVRNLYDMILPIKIKKEFLFTPSKKSLNCFP